MARRKNHHPKTTECGSNLKNLSAITKVNNSNITQSNNNNNNKAATCYVFNESSNIKRNGIKNHSEDDDAAEESEEGCLDDEVADGGDDAEEVPAQSDESEERGEAAGDDEDGDGEPARPVLVKSNNHHTNNNKRKKIKSKKKKRLGRPPQNTSMEDPIVQTSNSLGSQNQKLANGHNQTFTCPTCNITIDNQSEFTRHIRSHNASDPTALTTHSCSMCGKVLSSASSLDRHMLVHSGERPFKCTVCGMAFTTNGNMHRHMRTHHDVGVKSSSLSTNNHSPEMNNISNNNGSDEESNVINNRKSRGTSAKRKATQTIEGPNKKFAAGGISSNLGERNLGTKRNRLSYAIAENGEDTPEEEMDETENVPNGSIRNKTLPEDFKLRCPLCNKRVLCKSGLGRHMETHPLQDLICKACDETFANWQSLLKHLQLVHSMAVEVSTIVLDGDEQSSTFNLNNKTVDKGFHDLTFAEFSTKKFPLIAKCVCERHVRAPSSTQYHYKCDLCSKAFPSSSSLNLHQKTAHKVSNMKLKSSQQAAPTSTCTKCQAAFASQRQFINHIRRHQSTEHCATPYSRNVKENGHLPKTRQQVAGTKETETKIDKESFLALFELQSKKESEELEQDEEDDSCYNGYKINGYVNGSCNNNNNKPHRVPDSQSNDFADIQSILAVTQSNMIPSMLTGSSPVVTRPSSNLSSGLPESPRLADSVTASPELPSPNQNQLMTETLTECPSQDGRDSQAGMNNESENENENETSAEDDTAAKLTCTIDEDIDTEAPIEVDNNANNMQAKPFDLSMTTVAAPISLLALDGSWPRRSINPVPLPRRENAENQSPLVHQEEERPVVDLSRNANYVDPQDQPLNLVLQPLDLTVSASNKTSPTNANDSSLNLTSKTSSINSAIPMDLSASTRNRSSVVNHRLSPLMTSTPAAGMRRAPPQHNIAAPLPLPIVAVQPQHHTPLPSLPLRQPFYESSQSAFPTMFKPPVITAENYVTNNVNNSQHFQQDGIRRSLPAQPSTSQNRSHNTQVGENMTLSRQSTSAENSLRSVRPMPDVLNSMNSSSSTFLLKKQKQRRYRTERPFKCAYCEALFTLRSNMERHIKQQHPEKWASKARGRKERTLIPQPLSSSPRTTSMTSPLPLVPVQSRSLHSLQVPNVAFPSIPPPKNVSEYNPVLGASLALTRSPMILDESPSPPSRLAVSSNSSKTNGTISDEVRQAISNQIKQRQSGDGLSTLANAATMHPFTYSSISPMSLEENDSLLPSTSNVSTNENNTSGRILNSGGIRHLWRPAPQMESSSRQVAEDVDEGGADLASVSKLLTTATQQSIQELFRKRRNGDEEDDENDGNGSSESHEHRTEESDEDQPLASIKPYEMSSKSTERAKDGRKSAYGNAPNRVACPYCYRQFPWTSSLRRHVLTHTGQKPFKCPLCPLYFTTKSNCDRHLSRKHSNGSATADITENKDSTTSSNQGLSVNVSLASQTTDCTARNAPDRPYRCTKCLSSTFSTLSNLTKHMQTKHPNQVPSNVDAINGLNIQTDSQQENSAVHGKEQQQKDIVSPTPSERNGEGGEFSSGSERCWGGESEESGEEVNESSQQGDAVFGCFVCLKSFADRNHCLEHMKDEHPDDHRKIEVTSNDDIPNSVVPSSESSESRPEESSPSDRDISSPECEEH